MTEVGAALLVVDALALALAIAWSLVALGRKYGDPARHAIDIEVKRRLSRIRSKVRAQELADYMPAAELEADDFTVEVPPLAADPGPRPDEV